MLSFKDNIINKINNSASAIRCTIKNNDVKNNLDDYPYIKKFKNQKFEFRIQTSDKILLKYNERVPIIADCKAEINIDKNKYIVPRDLTIGQFLYILKKKINIEPTESIFLICNNILLINTETIASVYNKLKDEDGFLYICISFENTFG